MRWPPDRVPIFASKGTLPARTMFSAARWSQPGFSSRPRRRVSATVKRRNSGFSWARNAVRRPASIGLRGRAEHPQGARRRLQQIGGDRQQRGLARAVRAHQPADPAGRQPERAVPQGPAPPVLPAHAVRLYRDSSAWPHRVHVTCTPRSLRFPSSPRQPRVCGVPLLQDRRDQRGHVLPLQARLACPVHPRLQLTRAAASPRPPGGGPATGVRRCPDPGAARPAPRAPARGRP